MDRARWISRIGLLVVAAGTASAVSAGASLAAGDTAGTTGSSAATAPLAATAPSGEAEPSPPAGAPTDGASRPRTLALYGDSLAVEARSYVRAEAEARGWEVTFRVHGGTAPCDWGEVLAADLVDRPAVVVVAFSGNALTPCMRDPDTGAGFAGARHREVYRDDVAGMAESIGAAGSRATLVTPPVSSSGGGAELHAVFSQVASATGAELVDGGATIAPGGIYTETMPCLPDEGAAAGCVDGRIRVRAADGAHFCPDDHDAVDGVTPGCRTYASGARRYAELLLSPVLGRAAAPDPRA